MKIRNLSGAIRKLEGPAFVVIDTDIGRLRLPLMKSGVLAAIKEAQPDGMAETELSVNDDGDLVGWSHGGGHGEDFVLLGVEEADTPLAIDIEANLLDDETIDLEDAIAAVPTTETLDDDLQDLL